MITTSRADALAIPTAGGRHSTANPDVAQRGGSWDLVRAAQHGDTSAFAHLYDRYVDTIYRYLLLRVSTKEVAEDLTSETFLRALRGITSVNDQGRDVGAWFVSIARNVLLDHVKSSRHRREATSAEPDTGRPLIEPGPDEHVVTTLATDILLRCINQLGDDQRECIILRFLIGLSITETAHIMNRTRRALKALQRRAVRRLTELIPPELR